MHCGIRRYVYVYLLRMLPRLRQGWSPLYSTRGLSLYAVRSNYRTNRKRPRCKVFRLEFDLHNPHLLTLITGPGKLLVDEQLWRLVSVEFDVLPYHFQHHNDCISYRRTQLESQ